MKILNYAETVQLKEKLFVKMSMSAIYTSWPADFAKQQVVDYIARNATEVRIDPTKFLISEMLNLGFKWWDKKHDLLCIPLWMHPFLASGIELYSINGEKVTVELEVDAPFTPLNIDNDSRLGVLAFGVKVTKEETAC